MTGRRIAKALAMPALLLAIAVGFYWKLTLTDQYTWLDSPDFAHQVLPWYQFQASEFHRGRFPLWDPYEWGGHTLIGQAQPGIAYPLNWLLFALPLKRGFIDFAFVHWYYVLLHYLGALFCYLLCRDLKLGPAASLVGAVIFGFGGWMGTTDWPQMLGGAIWTPLVFLFLLRAVRGDRPMRHGALAGAFLGFAFLSGHHQIPIFVSLAAGGVWLYGLVRARHNLLPALAAFAILALLCSAFQMLPAVEYGKLSVRWAGATEPSPWAGKLPYSVHGRFNLTPNSMLGIVLPGVYENSNPVLGLTALTLAVFGVAAGWKRGVVRALSGVALGGLLFSFGPYSLLHGILYILVPMVDKARNDSMAVFVFHFGVAVLAAWGLDACANSEALRGRLGRRVLFGLTGFAAVLWTVLLALRFCGVPLMRGQHAVMPLVALLIAATLHGWRTGRVTARAAAVLLCAIVLMELGMGTSQSGWRNRDEGLSFVPRLSQDHDVANYLHASPGFPRVDFDDELVPYNFGDWHSIEHFGGYTASMPINITRVQPNDHARMLFSVRYRVGRKPSRPNQVEVFTGSSGLRIYENPDAFPRVWAVHAAKPLVDDDQLPFMLDGPLTELRQTAIVKGAPPSLETCADPDEVRLVDHIPNRVVIESAMSCRGMVIASETYFPGWEATVDGRPTPIYETYGALRGVVVPAGQHRIEMHYRPRSVRWGAAASLCGLLAACVVALALRTGPRPGSES